MTRPTTSPESRRNPLQRRLLCRLLQSMDDLSTAASSLAATQSAGRALASASVPFLPADAETSDVVEVAKAIFSDRERVLRPLLGRSTEDDAW